MLTRRIAASACALCLAVPTVAAAKPALRSSSATLTTASRSSRPATPRTTCTSPPTSRPSPATPRVTCPERSRPRQHARVVASAGRTSRAVADDGSDDGWQIAALVEGGLLAVVALGAAGALTARTRRNTQPAS